MKNGSGNSKEWESRWSLVIVKAHVDYNNCYQYNNQIVATQQKTIPGITGLALVKQEQLMFHSHYITLGGAPLTQTSCGRRPFLRTIRHLVSRGGTLQCGGKITSLQEWYDRQSQVWSEEVSSRNAHFSHHQTSIINKPKHQQHRAWKSNLPTRVTRRPKQSNKQYPCVWNYRPVWPWPRRQDHRDRSCRTSSG